MTPDIPLLKGILTGLLGIFGTLLGSFCNVVVLRMAVGKSVVFPPSACPHCNHRLSPFDLIPVFGWLLLRGKCRYCRAPISMQYPLVEAACGLTLAAAFHAEGFTPRLIPQAAWGVFMLVAAVLWLRGEVSSPRPFLYPLALRLPLEWWAGTPSPAGWAMALVLGGVATLIARLRNPHLHFAGWFGCAAIGLLATPAFSWWFPAGLAVVAILQAAFPLPADHQQLHPRRFFLFVWLLGAAVLCAIHGQWGFGV